MNWTTPSNAADPNHNRDSMAFRGIHLTNSLEAEVVNCISMSIWYSHLSWQIEI